MNNVMLNFETNTEIVEITVNTYHIKIKIPIKNDERANPNISS